MVEPEVLRSGDIHGRRVLCRWTEKYSILYIRGELHTFRKDSGGTSVIMQWVEPDSLLTLSSSENFLAARGKDAN